MSSGYIERESLLPLRFLLSLHPLNSLQQIIHLERFPAAGSKENNHTLLATVHMLEMNCCIQHIMSDFTDVPFGVCANVSMRHEGEGPVQEDGL